LLSNKCLKILSAVNVEIDCREEGTLLEFQLFVDRSNQVTEVDGLISNPRFIVLYSSLCSGDSAFWGVLCLRFNHSNATGIDIK
jgi:hypothetical protein